jgi:hypothetical protein
LKQEQQPSNARSPENAKRTMAAFALSFVAGILIFIQGIVRVVQGRAL